MYVVVPHFTFYVVVDGVGQSRIVLYFFNVITWKIKISRAIEKKRNPCHLLFIPFLDNHFSFVIVVVVVIFDTRNL